MDSAQRVTFPMSLSDDDLNVLCTAITGNLIELLPERFVTDEAYEHALKDPALVTMYFTDGVAEMMLVREFLRAAGWMVVTARDAVDGDYIVVTNRPDDRAEAEPYDHYVAIYRVSDNDLVVTHHVCGTGGEETVVDEVAEDTGDDLSHLGALLTEAGWIIQSELNVKDAAVHPDLADNATLGWFLRDTDDGPEWVCTVLPSEVIELGDGAEHSDDD